MITISVLGALAIISTTVHFAEGVKKWVDPDSERAAKVAGYVKCIGPCLQEAVTNPENEPCHLSGPDSRKCLATLTPFYLPCVEKCTGRTMTPPDPTIAAVSQSLLSTLLTTITGDAPAAEDEDEDDDAQEAFMAKYF
ncbi:hypothetical protein BGX33_010888 [Mortierella sp. NVP41]|nr:hypothetical protein BGX33_010888 [Mortierella sp. NVP41]